MPQMSFSSKPASLLFRGNSDPKSRNFAGKLTSRNGKWTVKLLKFGIWPKNVMGDHRHPGCIGASLIFACLTVVESVYWYTYQFQSAASNETHGKLSLWMSVWLIGQTNRFPAKHLQHLQEDLGMSFAVLRHIRDQFKAWRR